jgi:hypothetical protein
MGPGNFDVIAIVISPMWKNFTRISLVVACVALSFAAEAQVPERTAGTSRGMVELEGGAVWSSRNSVRIPGDSGTRFDLNRLTGTGPNAFARVNASYEFSQRHGIRVLYAPLQVRGTGTRAQTTRFEGMDFAPGVPTEATYKFNSYRVTYRYRFRNSDRSDWRVGLTLKVRDAKIALRQGSVYEEKADLGVVPLLHLYGEERLSDRWRFIFDFDGLAAPQGRAFDVALKVGYDVTPQWQAQAGYRILEGGADNDEVYNFALLNYGLLGIAYRF